MRKIFRAKTITITITITITTMTMTETNACAGLTVLYDGACPLCRREVGVYRDLTPLQPLQWLDVSQPLARLPDGGARATYLARFHVQRADGTLLSGAAAFVALWLTLPGWRWLGRIGSLPGATPLLEIAYRFFLCLRPGMQGFARALEARAVRARSGVESGAESAVESAVDNRVKAQPRAPAARVLFSPLSSPNALRALLLVSALATVWAAAAVGNPAAYLKADGELATLLRGMAVIKMGIVSVAMAVLIWRFGRAINPRTAIAYLLGTALMAGATTLVWQLTVIPLAAVFFHVGELLLLLVAWRDYRSDPVTHQAA